MVSVLSINNRDPNQFAVALGTRVERNRWGGGVLTMVQLYFHSTCAKCGKLNSLLYLEPSEE